MEKSAENYKAEYKNITIKTTDGSTIYGKINIGEKERVSDIFTRSHLKKTEVVF